MNVHKGREEHIVRSILLLVTLAFLVSGASAVVLSIDNGQVNAIGSSAAVNITLDSAPNGLAGYSINITLGTSSVATISDTSFPGWATNTEVIPDPPSSSCRVKALDGEEKIQDGSTEVTLATLTLQGLSEGVTPVTLTVNLMSDDDDNDIFPTVISGSFTVNTSGALKADFYANSTSGNAPLTVQFTDLSLGSPTSWAWDFQNDGSTESTLQNPVFTYAAAGAYTVKLTATNAGGSDEEIKTNYINVTTAPPDANFTANKTSGKAPLTVQFTDLSLGSPTSWAWDFQDDGSTDSTAQNPVFTYPDAGLYTVRLTATNAGGSTTETRTNYISVAVAPPVPDFTANKTSGNYPLTVQFTDLSTGSPATWDWDFQDDGTVDSHDKNPVFTYSTPGNYSVRLMVGNAGGSDYLVREDYITVSYNAPVANFTANTTSGYVPLTVQFTDLSTGIPTSWAWDFENDGSTDSTAQNPEYTYPSVGNYTVKLTVTNPSGSTSEIKTDYIRVLPPPPVAQFTANKTAGNAPLTVQFTDLSTGSPTSWAWDFQNDGSTDSTAKNPVFPYATPGLYSVKLTATNAGGSDPEIKTNYINVTTAPPVANFTANKTAGTAPLTVQFTDLSTGSPMSWAWDFQNDGTTDSTVKNPVFTYAAAGTYTVKLTATNAGGSDPEIKSNYITVTVAPPTANFTANKTAGNAPLTVQFTDQSTGSPTSWAWDFQNDGSTDSSTKNPVFTYATPGLYSVKLTATNAGGSDPEIKTNYINVTTAPPVANFTANKTAGTAPLTVQFTDLSTGTPTSWAWDFQNDGTVDSTVKNPVFTYATPGLYSVKLTATNTGGSNTTVRTNYINVTTVPPVANFTANKTSGGAPLTVQFTDLSTGSPTSWAWDFQNDGSTDSTVKNPVFTYAMPGLYSVKLSAANAGGSDVEIKTSYINVTTVPPVANFKANKTTGGIPLTVQFTDLSTGSPTSWAWDFQNDGTTDSSVQNPAFTYTTPGTYTVNLTATNSKGSDSEVRTNYITVSSGPSLAVTTPNGGEIWTQGSSHNLTWTYSGELGSSVKIEILKGTPPLATLASSASIGTGGSGSYLFTFPYYTPLANDYKIRITSNANPAYSDTSDAAFSITSAITVASPNGGETWLPSTTQTLRWNYTDSPGDTVRIEILRSGAALATLASSAPLGTGGSGSLNFPFPSYTPLGTDYQIKVTSNTYPACTDTSDGYFAFSLLPSITVTAPNGGETWPQNSTQTIQWSYTEDPGSQVLIELLRGTTVQQVITAGTSLGSGGSGSFSFAVPTSLPLGSDYKVRITSTSNASYTDTSDAAFTVSEPTSIRVVAPEGGATLYRGDPLVMNWSYTGTPGPTVTIEVFKGPLKMATLPNIPVGSGGNGTFSVKQIPAGTPVGADYTVTVTSTLSPTITDTGDAFAISGPTIHVASPNGGETFPRGGPLAMSWTYKGNPGSTVNIEVYRGESRLATLQNIPIGTGGAGSYSVPAIPMSTPADTVYRIKVISTLYADCSDMSDGTFTIS
ncbi:MAG: PKD domain protein [Euryarchaeota archaeon ADurb.BinA087]|nr:MAG: PKD domain protein [Euryarchaeota archaeon ADurb.BinA087]